MFGQSQEHFHLEPQEDKLGPHQEQEKDVVVKKEQSVEEDQGKGVKI